MGAPGLEPGLVPAPLSPLRQRLAAHAPVLGTTPSSLLGTARLLEAEPRVDTASSDSSPAGSVQTSDDGEEQPLEENRPPPSVNRATTPPRGRLSKLSPPPGLGIDASPMKVELRSSGGVDGAASAAEQDLLLGLTRQEGLMKVQPLLPGW